MIAPARATLWMIAAAATMAFVAADRMPAGGPAERDAGASAALSPSDPPPADAAPTRDRALIRPAARDPFSPPPAPPVAPPPPPVAVVAAPPPPPQAPALPFRYFGRLSAAAGAPGDFVERSGRLLSVTPGEVIDDVYRVQEITDREIVFLHLPTRQRQALPLPPP